MKVGTDGVVLGSWFDTGPAGCRILDIGTGSGLVALMAAQRNPSAAIDAVECDRGSCLDAACNFSASAWCDNMALHNVAVQEYTVACTVKYDRIVSNPPYFVDSLRNPDAGRRMARHVNDTLPFDELLGAVTKLLLPEGVFSVILPPQETEYFMELASAQGLYPVRILFVYPTESGQIKRIVTEFSYGRKQFSTEKLVIEASGRHHYSEEYRRLTGDFYLDF